MCHSAEHAAATRQQLRNYKRLLPVLLWSISEQSLKNRLEIRATAARMSRCTMQTIVSWLLKSAAVSGE
jgi:hypothetical protein